MSSLTESGIAALKQGDKAKARQLLLEAILKEPNNLQAWLWLSGAVETVEEQIDCLRQVQRIDPENRAAAKGIAYLTSQVESSKGTEPVLQSSGSVENRRQERSINLERSENVERSTILERGIEIEDQVKDLRETVGKGTIFTERPSLLPTGVLAGVTFLVTLFLLFFSTPIFRDSTIPRLTQAIIFSLTLLAVLILSATLIRKLIPILFAQYTLTDRALVVLDGAFKMKQKTIPLHEIQSVSCQQSALERFFEVGDLLVEIIGEERAIRLVNLEDCEQRRKDILDLIPHFDSITGLGR